MGPHALKPWRPGPTIAFLHCSGVTLSGITIRDNPFFAVLIHGCQAGQVAGLRIATDHRFQNGDGIHVVSSRNLTIAGCQVDSQDDALAFYTNWWGRPDTEALCSGIAVTNCVLSSACCGIRIGYASDGHLRDTVFSNIAVTQANRGIDYICNARNAITLALSPSGPAVHALVFANIVTRDVDWGLSGNIEADSHEPAGIHDILYTAMKVRSRRGNYLVGTPEIPVRRITFRDVDFTVTGTIDAAPGAIPDPLPIFGPPDIPHAFLLRHAEDVRFLNTRVAWDGAPGHWRSGPHVSHGRDIDTSDLQVVPLRDDWGPGVTED